MTLDDINRIDRDAFVAALGGIFEHSPWVAERVFALRPFPNVDALHDAMVFAMHGATPDEQLALVLAHPELAGRAMVAKALTADSSREQSGAGLTECSDDEYARLVELNARYNAKFGFPFILAVKGHDRQSIIAEFARREQHDMAVEFAQALGQIARIARFRLEALLQSGSDT